MEQSFKIVRKRLDPAATRQRILEAALDAFASQGYFGASIGDIAAKAETRKSLVQYHFGSKEALWQACVSHYAAPVIAAIDSWLDSDSNDPRSIIEARFQLFSSQPEVGRLLSWASLTALPFPEPILARRERIQQRIGGKTQPLMLHFLFALSATDGWFQFRNLYQKAVGDVVIDDLVSQELLRTILASFDL